MINKKIFFSFIILFFFNFTSYLKSNDDFNFDFTEIEIINEGNFFKGLKRGKVETNNGQIIIEANTFEYDKIKKILISKGNVVIEDKIKNYYLESEEITYFKEKEEIFSKSKTKLLVESKYEIVSDNITVYRNSNLLRSNNKSTIIDDDFNQYNTETLYYEIDNKLFKGNNVFITTNINKENIEKEKFHFKEGIFDLENKDFVASDTKIKIKKNSFDESDNDPRIYGNSSKRIGNIININKAIFTSCKLTDSCPPWSIKSDKIIHDQEKKDIIYDNPIMRIYDFPVFYFPKFSHPDPTVRRRSGLLKPQFNNSNVTGSSLFIPYFHVISETKDITLKPTIFDSEIYMLHAEYNQINENSNFVMDLGLTKGFQSSNDNRNNIAHFLSKFTKKLNLNNFINSEIELNIQKTTKDTFFKVFDSNLIDMNQNVKPANKNKLESNINLYLENENYFLDLGFTAYEDLQGNNSDRYQYILPYYNFSNTFYRNKFLNFEFLSNGSNSLKETNKLSSIITNDLNIKSNDFISEHGLINKYDIYFKNLNKVGKNIENIQSKPQIELMNIVNFQSSFPLIKFTNTSTNTITPKMSFRLNPGDMNNHVDLERTLNTDNIFNINRLGLSEDLEGGKSLTLGIDYKKESLKDINKYFEIKLAGVLRDTIQKDIPSSSSLGQTASNLFGKIDYNLSEVVNLNYDFALDNNLSTFEKNSIGLGLSFLRNLENENKPRITTNFMFTEKNGKFGDTNVLENSTTLNFNEENFLTFNTRRNRKINFTEYYDLVYEYKNDCLVAGIKYKKSYYEDRDLKPKEDLLFTITFFPITQYEQKIDQSVYRGENSLKNILD